MNADEGDMTRTRPDDFRTKTSGATTAVAIQVTSVRGMEISRLAAILRVHLLDPLAVPWPTVSRQSSGIP